ncbi:hypothetical protein PR202_ga06228 [Eleusine coracana subsp. coracana]|uniref:Uncharacterized protein n=1 Tax=Eleusine coracana subsp. coracana TaxID=191504 RepID=A0AAV5BWP8_ELECO|nr:hypothetical protein PR202_ga06228 [Eleusine coracana subsp. coracana]
MELITGRRAVEPEFGEGQDIVGWVRDKIRTNTVEEFLDPNVGGRCAHVREEMLLVLRIAVLCTARAPRDRPIHARRHHHARRSQAKKKERHQQQHNRRGQGQTSLHHHAGRRLCLATLASSMLLRFIIRF